MFDEENPVVKIIVLAMALVILGAAFVLFKILIFS